MATLEGSHFFVRNPRFYIYIKIKPVITLQPTTSNTFVLYVSTLTNEVQTFGDYFLLKFINGFTKENVYVVPSVLIRNSRFIKLQIDLVPNVSVEDPINASVYLAPSGNWDYTLYNIFTPTLDPSGGILLDQGQMVLEDNVIPEVKFVPYVSNNENLSSYVYYSPGNVWNTTSNLWESYENLWQNA